MNAELIIADPSRAQLRGAIVGFGSIGRRHFENLASLGVTQCVVVRRKDQPNPAFNPPAETPVVFSDNAAIQMGLDFAIVCNPTRRHVDTARRYAAAGAAVLIEKPLCALDDVASAEQLCDELRRGGATAGMAYCMRYHPAYRLAHEFITSGRIGRVLYAKAWFEGYLPDWHPWEDYRQSYAARRELGGGALPTLDHEIDFLNWCLGRPESAIGQIANSGSLGVDVNDHASLTINYPGPLAATVVLSLCRRDRRRGFEFVGASGTLRFNMEESLLELCAPDQRSTVLWRQPTYRMDAMYVDMLEDFISALSTNRQAPTPIEAGLDAARVCSAAIEMKELTASRQRPTSDTGDE